MFNIIKFIIFLFITTFFINNATASPNKVKICSVVQLYSTMTALQHVAPYKFDLVFDTPTDLYARIANNELQCDLLLSSDERLPITLIRGGKGQASGMVPFAIAPLILLAKDPNLFKYNLNAISKKQLKSLALPDARLTPVGFATHQIVKTSAFPTEYLKSKIYRADQEYQILSLISNGYVQAGFVTLPLYKDLENPQDYSYWLIPRKYYPDIFYYVLLLKNAVNNNNAINIMRYLVENPQVVKILKQYGFEDPNNISNEKPQKLKNFR